MGSHRAQAFTHNLLRITAGLFYLMHGGQKLLGWFGGMDGQGMTATLSTLPGVAGGLELVGGSLMLVGLFARPVAFLLSGEMAVAYFTQHFPHGFWPIQNHGEPAVLYCFVWLYFAGSGAGAFSLDHLLSRRHEHREHPRHMPTPATAMPR